ncbi:ABC transporter ATP-binding protein [Corynebacterium sp. 335C]
MTDTPRLRLRGVSAGYGGDPVVDGVDLDVPVGAVTTLIGPNGCGKSTLLKAVAGLLPHGGEVLLDDEPVRDLPRRDRARRLSMLPQAPVAPEGLTVRQLVGRGRHPHQSWLRQWSEADEEAVAEALARTGAEAIADRPVRALSGGQRQRAWIAMSLAQGAPTMLLDEPTTYLDLAHAVEVLRLVRGLRDDRGDTIVMVLHDLNLAARYSDALVALDRTGRVAAAGAPGEVLTERTLLDVFGLEAAVLEDPHDGGPLVVPHR